MGVQHVKIRIYQKATHSISLLSTYVAKIAFLVTAERKKKGFS